MGLKDLIDKTKDKSTELINEMDQKKNSLVEGVKTKGDEMKDKYEIVDKLSKKGEEIKTNREIKNAEKNKYVFDDNLPAMEQLEKISIEDVSLVLKDNERCIFSCPAKAINQVERSTGRKGGYTGVSLRVAKGVTVHTGGANSTNIRQTVNEEYPGTFYLTNMRIILLSRKYGFEISLADSKVQGLKFYSDGLEFYEGTKYHIMTFDKNDAKNVREVLLLMSRAYDEQENDKKESDNNSNENKPVESNDRKFEEIKKYKELLDEGIISQEDFDKKKKELLGL